MTGDGLVLTNSGLVVKFDFNVIMIDKEGIHKIDLSSSDPIGKVESEAKSKEVEVAVPNPPIDVGVPTSVAA